MAIAIIHETDDGIAVSRLWDGARRPAVIVHHPAEPNIAEAWDETVQPAETIEDFAARMVSTLVPDGARHVAVMDDATLPDVSPDRWIVDWATGAITAGNEPMSVLIAYAADRRWQAETGGYLDPAGRRIATDRDSQTKLIAEMVALSAGLRADPSPWKLADGSFALLTNAEMLAAIMAARTHISASFATEAVVLAAIASGTITTKAQIDAADWPGSV